MNTMLRMTGIVAAFGIAMAALEGAVVVYLRALYYPDEFSVQLKIIDEHILLVEIIREFATLVMLLAVGYMAGKNFRERFAYFLLAFGVWDIFYYIWLKIFIGWPASFFDWDILFLIPVTWIGPVGAPVVCSLTMIMLAIFLLRYKIRISKTVWAYLTLGAILVLFTFMRDYSSLIIQNGFAKDFPHFMQNRDFVEKAATLIPQPYPWNVFLAGELMFILALVNLWINKNRTTECLHYI